jgi:GDPmannose 4,6-dehydratase
MFPQNMPDDFILATGETTTVRKFIEMAFIDAGIQIQWIGNSIEEKGYGPDGKMLVDVLPQFFRPIEVELLIGDATKAQAKLGWIPKASVAEFVKLMMDADQEFI